MSNWNGVDFFIFLIFLLNILLGMARGASKEIISMMCLCGALIFTIKFTVPVVEFLNSSPLITDFINSPFLKNFMTAIGMGPVTIGNVLAVDFCIGLLLCFVGVFSTLEAVLISATMVQIFSWPWATLDRKVGGALGFLRGYVFTVVFVLMYIVLHIDMGNSYFVRLFRDSADTLNSLIVAQAPDRYREIFKGKDLYKESDILRAVTYPAPTDTQTDSQTDTQTPTDSQAPTSIQNP